MNQTVFTSEDVVLNISEKAIIVTLWLLIELVGSGMLIGLIQFERLNGDPLKRRIVDQVRFTNKNVLYRKQSRSCFLLTFSFSFSQLNMVCFW